MILKSNLHPRNKHNNGYNFDQLIRINPELKSFVHLNRYNTKTIDFSDPAAVKQLNKALLESDYNISGWDIPDNYLCPPVPGRADYIHYAADLLSELNNKVPPAGSGIKVIDIGCGANCIYPLLGHAEYGWTFIATDIDPLAISNANRIISYNRLGDMIECRIQRNPLQIFNGVLSTGEKVDFSICNPPFHRSYQEAIQGTKRKWRNLGMGNERRKLNFGGKNNELWCEGGEEGFIKRMIEESAAVHDQCLWFTSLVSKSSALPFLYKHLRAFNAVEVKTIDMSQGQKQSRILAWTFMNYDQQADWAGMWSRL